MKLQRTILVTGATGRQGGATARCLLRNDWKVRAFCRDGDKPAARDLALQGAEIALGNLDDPASIRSAMQGCYGVFSVQNFYETGVEGEIRQGCTLADLAKGAGVEHFVYASVGSADQKTGIPFFDTKWKIEEHIRSLNLPHTILRPVFFFDNFSDPPMRKAILSGTLSLPMEEDTPLQMIAVSDIGAFAAMAFGEPEQFLGRALDIAGDELTMPRTADVFSSVLGRPVKFVPMPIAEMEKTMPAVATMFRWFNNVGYHVNIRTLRGIYPQLRSLATWLRETDWASKAWSRAA